MGRRDLDQLRLAQLQRWTPAGPEQWRAQPAPRRTAAAGIAAPSAAGTRDASRSCRRSRDAGGHRTNRVAAAAMVYPAREPSARPVGNGAAGMAAIRHERRLGTGPAARLPEARLPP